MVGLCGYREKRPTCPNPAMKINPNQLYGLLPTEADGIETLIELALDVQWSWNHVADELWQQLDSELWDRTHNPWIILQTVSREVLEQKLSATLRLNSLLHYPSVDAQVASSGLRFNHFRTPNGTTSFSPALGVVAVFAVGVHELFLGDAILFRHHAQYITGPHRMHGLHPNI